MKEVFGPEERSAELQLFDLVHPEDFEEAVVLLHKYCHDGTSPKKAIEIIVEELKPIDALRSVTDRS